MLWLNCGSSFFVMTITSNYPRRILVCQNRSCRKSGSRKILEAFAENPVPDVEVIGVGCLGKCGNGPMVLILPEEIWYWQVHPKEVPMIIKKHFRSDSKMTTRMSPEFQQN